MTVATKTDAVGNRTPVQGTESEPGFLKHFVFLSESYGPSLSRCSGDVLVPEAALGGLEGDVVVCHC